ncbi:hypothetical protein PTSG_02404 [Salpingoeca rosetta]|uniref:TGF-beta propeptide domain-containing protein n=1 Tax=Salpingoeca rosetta (strain ATCC 50818 / BSB-021) TaxID=946362 RepID=F2U239_SALR5|nr:uncharacterized protein PTSG_02404 [Salpingoeca rosetta]EGD81691.1 hypothetical protein PTSG_02404 [Salpingoeca rosetta]|eukprot:XP_004996895.1 hypothetical protein PTSG_02404 [Salpingoeca rosetta]
MQLVASALVLAVALLATVAWSVSADPIDLRATEDTTICDSNTEEDLANALGDGLYVGVTGRDLERRALVKFNVTDVPNPDGIQNVTFVLYERSNPKDQPANISLHRVLQEWHEGMSFFPGGACAPSSSIDASWNYSVVNQTRWQAPGGSFVATPSVLTEVGKDTAFYTWSGDGLIDDVKFWVANPEQNFGWILLNNQEGARSVKSFASRQAADAEDIPRLIIGYDLAPSPPPGNPDGSSSDKTVIIAVVVSLGAVAIIGVVVMYTVKKRSRGPQPQQLAADDYGL